MVKIMCVRGHTIGLHVRTNNGQPHVGRVDFAGDEVGCPDHSQGKSWGRQSTHSCDCCSNMYCPATVEHEHCMCGICDDVIATATLIIMATGKRYDVCEDCFDFACFIGAGNNIIKCTEISVGDVPKTKGATYRGTQGTGVMFYGKGLYSTTDIEEAEKYGTAIGLVGGMPEKPLIIDGKKECFNDWCRRESGLNIRAFNKRWPDPGVFVRTKGYDGVIDGHIIVKYA